MSNLSNDIKRYVNGEMTSAERHALERKALYDPFLADALEGVTQLSSSQFASDVGAIKKRMSKSRLDKRIIQINVWRWTAGIAAGLLLICASFFVIWEITRTQKAEKQLALKEDAEINIPEVIAADSVVSSSADKSVTETKPSSKATVRSRSSSPIQSPVESPSFADAKAEGEGYGNEEEAESKSTVAELKTTDDVAKEEETSNAAQTQRGEAEKFKLSKKDYAAEKTLATKSSDVVAYKNATPNLIQGKVTNEDGVNLAGINVQIKGTTTGTVTDSQGSYQIQSTIPAPALVYSFIGLESQEVAIENKREVNVQMPTAYQQQSEVIITGYALQNQNPKPTVDLAHPKVGSRNYKKYLAANLRYPALAREKKTEGNVVVEFFIEADGSLTDFLIVRSIGFGCDEELIRLIKEGPEWMSTKNDSLPVRDKAQVQLKFELPKK